MALYNYKGYFAAKVEKSDDDDNHDGNNDDNNTNTATTTTNKKKNENKRCMNQLWFSNLLQIIYGKWLKINNQSTLSENVRKS